MNHKSLLAAALAAGSLMGLGVAAHATPAVVAGTTPYTTNAAYYGAQPAPYYGQTQVYGNNAVVVQSPPPAPMYEAVPAPRQGYIWAPGHYVWDNGRYAWRGGEWIASRQGYGWQAAHWEQRADGSWYLVGGNWVRMDNYAANDDGRREWQYRDRDGDGVINRDDRYPRDPYRR